jgi:hypothetical protein
MNVRRKHLKRFIAVSIGGLGLGMLITVFIGSAIAFAQTTTPPVTTTPSTGPSTDWSAWIIFAVVIFALFWVLTRGRGRGTNTRLQTVINAISNVNDNLKIMEMHRINKESTKKFKTLDWDIYKTRLSFLDEQAADALKTSYSMMNGFNEKIETARKTKSTGILQEIQIDNLNEPLTKGKQGLAAWLRENINKEMSTRRGILGF